MMKPSVLRTVFLHEDLNFLATNRIPRIAASRLMGRFAAIESPLLTRVSIAVWRLFADVDLDESPPVAYRSLRECFTRPLVAGARPIASSPSVLASPSDGIVGACGRAIAGQVFQAKGFPYALADLFGPTQDATSFVDGTFVTLRLTSGMYHRFHAPHDLVIDHVTHRAGDTWNVNPIALKRVERLFCRNERAVVRAHLRDAGHPIVLVAVAAILVAGIRLHALGGLLRRHPSGLGEHPCAAQVAKGDELGWFEHGSTILVFAPNGFALARGIVPGARIRMGEPLMHLPDRATT